VSAAHRQTTPLMRFALLLGALLTFLAGVQLFVLTDHTTDWFAWTVNAGSAATIIGGFYWTACVLSYLSWRRRDWVEARVGVPGVTAFLWATLLTTLVHLDKFHLSDASLTGEGAAWAWLVIYVVDPVLVTTAWILQSRAPGADAERSSVLSPWYRRALTGTGALFLVVGVMMMAAPSVVIGRAPFPLTDLTSRAIGSWVIAMGGVYLMMAWENDRDRVWPAAVASVVAPILFAAGTLRYRDEFTWDAAGWSYLVALGFLAALGATGLGIGSRDAGS